MMKAPRRHITPRKVAWGVVLLGLAWFIYVSPKTPLAFFDAGVRDADELQTRIMEKHLAIDAEAAAQEHIFYELSSYTQQQNRIALIHDLKNNPKQVRKEKSWIVTGFYPPDARTDENLRANDEHYRALADKIAERRAALRANNKEWGPRIKHLRDAVNKDKSFNASISLMEMDCLALRNYQAWLFWWEGR